MEHIESPFRIEQEPGLKHVHRFFAMNGDEEKTLKGKIEAHDGLVRVFVHPDFKEYAEFKNMKSPDVARLSGARQIFEKLLKLKSEDMPPIFIFESGTERREFEEKEVRLDSITQNDLYIVRTQFANPDPLSPDRESTYQWPVWGNSFAA